MSTPRAVNLPPTINKTKLHQNVAQNIRLTITIQRYIKMWWWFVNWRPTFKNNKLFRGRLLPLLDKQLRGIEGRADWKHSTCQTIVAKTHQNRPHFISAKASIVCVLESIRELFKGKGWWRDGRRAIKSIDRMIFLLRWKLCRSIQCAVGSRTSKAYQDPDKAEGRRNPNAYNVPEQRQTRENSQ